MMEYFNNIFINKYMKHMNKKSEISETDKERLKFALSVLLNEIQKAVVIIIIFSWMNKLLPLAVSVITLMSIRMELGGFHCKKNWQCFLVTLSYFLSTIMAADYFKMPVSAIIVIDIVSFISILIFTPINSKIRNVNDNNIRKRLKIRVSIIMLVIFLAQYLISEKCRNYIVWSLVFILIEISLQVISRFRKRCIDNEGKK